MPAKQGNKSINVSLPEALVEQLDLLAKQAGADRSQVVAEAIQGHLATGAQQSLLEQLHARQDRTEGRLAAVEQTLTTLAEHLWNVQTLVQAQAQRTADFQDAANVFYDYVSLQTGRRALPWGSRWRKVFGGTNGVPQSGSE